MSEIPLPPNHFIRVQSFLGIPEIMLMRSRKFWFPEKVAAMWMDTGDEDDIHLHTQALVDLYYERKQIQENLAKYSGDYTISLQRKTTK